MIQLSNLSIGYSKKKPLITNINYTFNDNNIYCLMGESGKGKTTLLKTISGLIKPIDGNININGNKLKSARQSGIYMMHQNYTCFDWLSCLDNILIAQKVKCEKVTDDDIKRASDTLNSVGLHDYENYYPQQLSGGMRQRLALARTIFVKPSIILMDEPLSALDEDTRSKMQNLIKYLHNETKNIVIMITHSRDEALKMADNIVEISTFYKR